MNLIFYLGYKAGKKATLSFYAHENKEQIMIHTYNKLLSTYTYVSSSGENQGLKEKAGWLPRFRRELWEFFIERFLTPPATSISRLASLSSKSERKQEKKKKSQDPGVDIFYCHDSGPIAPPNEQMIRSRKIYLDMQSMLKRERTQKHSCIYFTVLKDGMKKTAMLTKAENIKSSWLEFWE